MSKRRTKCQVIEDQEIALRQQVRHNMTHEAAVFEQEGWSLTFELAPRCDDATCWVCNDR